MSFSADMHFLGVSLSHSLTTSSRTGYETRKAVAASSQSELFLCFQQIRRETITCRDGVRKLKCQCIPTSHGLTIVLSDSLVRSLLSPSLAEGLFATARPSRPRELDLAFAPVEGEHGLKSGFGQARAIIAISKFINYPLTIAHLGDFSI